MAKPGEITKTQVSKFKKVAFMEEVVKDVPDSDALGLMVSRYSRFDGGEIIRAFHSALEDANFHAENRVLREAFPWAFE